MNERCQTLAERAAELFAIAPYFTFEEWATRLKAIFHQGRFLFNDGSAAKVTQLHDETIIEVSKQIRVKCIESEF